MTMYTIDDVLTEISKYSLDDKELITDILRKRIIEEKRQKIYDNYQESMKNYLEGNIKKGGVDDLFEGIESHDEVY